LKAIVLLPIVEPARIDREEARLSMKRRIPRSVACGFADIHFADSSTT
jgi:hypothetical protein